MTLVAAICVVCGGENVDPVYPGTIAPAELRDPAVYFSSSRLVTGYLPVVRCARCGLLMTSPRDDDATLGRIYAELADHSSEVEDGARSRTVADRLALVGSYRRLPGRLLDVGCGTGVFVCAAQDGGWEATGVDASAWAVAMGGQRCPRARFRAGLLSEIDFPAGSFDVVTLWDVLEHVPRPVETLEKIRSWLALDGWLFLSLPNAESRIARLMGKRWVLLLREHLWYFSPATIAALLSRTGFMLDSVRPKLVPFSLAHILDRLAQYPGAAGTIAGRLPAIGVLRRIAVRVPIGEMYVVARRTRGQGREASRTARSADEMRDAFTR
ncbi:MAG: class I SAM-dependent methyltransferase [Candidatus Rokuibacteriota bacterium]